MPRCVGIVGTGLIGASIGLRLRALGVNVLGYDREPQHAQRARARGAIDSVAGVEHMFSNCDVMVFATPVLDTVQRVESLARTRSGMPALVMDVASVKGPVVSAARGLPAFVATHPMAGREQSGPDAAQGDLFDGKPWLYVPAENAEVCARAVAFIENMGARPVAISAGEHDALVALTSHLPQVFAYLFAHRVQRLELPAIASFCGPVARELLRLSGSSAALWHDIFLTNGMNIAHELRALAAELEAAAAALERDDVTPILP